MRLIHTIMATLLLTNMAYADGTGIKTLIHDALREGHSEGVLDDNIAKLFRIATGSQKEIYVTIKKIKNYEGGCGRLRVEFKQSGIKDSEGNLTTGTPGLEISICPDGQPPRELQLQEEERAGLAIKSCVTKIEKGSVDHDTGAMKGVINASGCPIKGKSHWRYTGECSALKMPDNIVSTFPIDKDGEITVRLLIPAQCISVSNSWNAVIRGQDHRIVGSIQTTW